MRHLRFTFYVLRRTSARWFSAGLAASFLALPTLHAHDSPEHVVEQLTARMAAGGTNAMTLWERATEYRALGRLASAARDLHAAEKLQPDFLPALTDLARVEVALGKIPAALATMQRALSRVRAEGNCAPLYMARAEVYQAGGDFTNALADCDLAFALMPAPDAEWHLTRAQLQSRLGRYEEAAAGLARAFEQTANPVLEAEWIDALLDAGSFRPALERVEPALAQSRCQSSWLVRRARARLGLGQNVPARGDLHAAVTEINARLNPRQPDAGLLAERGLALALLGDPDSARHDLAAARRQGVDEVMARRVEAALAHAPRRAVR